MGTSTGIIMVEKWGDVATSPEEGTPSMEVLTATRAAGEPPRPRRILMTRFAVTGALAVRVGWRLARLGWTRPPSSVKKGLGRSL